MPRPLRFQPGFSLIELTIVLVIIALLSSGLILGITAQRDAIANQDAQRQLDNAREALLGFAITNGRLPCPAVATLATSDANAGKENCTSQHGVLPWATLGLPETDPWGQRLTYYANNNFTTAVAAGATAAFTLDTVGNASVKESLSAGSDLASALPAVIVCHGSRGAGGYQNSGSQISGAAGEEAENADADTLFIAHTPTETFDDLLTWINPSILKSKLVAAGKLP